LSSTIEQGSQGSQGSRGSLGSAVRFEFQNSEHPENPENPENPLIRSFFSIDRRSGDVVLSALKQAEDRSSTIVRLFNPGDTDARVVVGAGVPIAQAFAVNFLEERQADLPIEGGAVTVVLKPRQIHTVELVA
jgi:alpha-mannosidase